MSWDNDILAAGLRNEIRLAGQTQAALSGSTQAVDADAPMVAEGVLPETVSEVRARLVAGQRTIWTEWVVAITEFVRFGREDTEVLNFTQNWAGYGVNPSGWTTGP